MAPRTPIIEFMLSARRDVSAAKRFFKKLMRADHRRLPFTIGTDEHASYPEAFATSVKEKVLPPDCKLRRVKYLNNVIEQDHRAIRRRWRAMQCFRSFHTAERTLEGVEAAHMMRKGQVKRLDGRDVARQARFVASLFGIAAYPRVDSQPSSSQSNFRNATTNAIGSNTSSRAETRNKPRACPPGGADARRRPGDEGSNRKV